ncbi:hypothetical protein QTJ16_004198 [Diplocarpon rosae]|uniref:Uncharacterized protein n=1 Tax=Diplocarpon rosae TaxID=946125 RepID=A0AAD9SYT4_9HELO|nr:hypothetical protein QTJ16_004198 [Diplocarpon rosae]
MALSSNSWYTPKNYTHIFLCGFAATVAFTVILVSVFRREIHASVTDICASISIQKGSSNQFEENLTYQTLDSAADDIWKQLVTPNGGFIIDESRNDTQIYGIAMFHQLHCVQMFRRDYQGLFARLGEGGMGKRNMEHRMDMQHTLHCLDYLRQVFLCYADGSIEPTFPDPEGKGGVPKTNGMVPHQCQDSSVLYEKSLASRWSDKHKEKQFMASNHRH